MNTNFSINQNSLIGDTVLPEPALYALGEKLQTKISLSGVHPDHAFLYADHPWVELTDKPGKDLDPWIAMQWGHQHKRSMYFGFHPQVGVEPVGRDHYQSFSNYEKFHCKFFTHNEIAFIPWARSCIGHNSKNANLMNHDLSWWTRLAQKTSFPCTSYGGPYVPDIPGTRSIRNIPLYDSVGQIANSKVVVTVQTGLCHVMEGCRTKNTIFLAPRDSWLVNHNTDQPIYAPHCQTPILSREKDGSVYWDENEVLEKIQEMLR